MGEEFVDIFPPQHANLLLQQGMEGVEKIPDLTEILKCKKLVNPGCIHNSWTLVVLDNKPNAKNL